MTQLTGQIAATVGTRDHLEEQLTAKQQEQSALKRQLDAVKENLRKLRARAVELGGESAVQPGAAADDRKTMAGEEVLCDYVGERSAFKCECGKTYGTVEHEYAIALPRCTVCKVVDQNPPCTCKSVKEGVEMKARVRPPSFTCMHHDGQTTRLCLRCKVAVSRRITKRH